ncbi:MAG: hypothetical protein RR952_06630 [Cetobacterium sp.]
MMNNKNVEFDMDKAIEAVLAIFEKEEKISPMVGKIGQEAKITTYDGHGTVVEIDGVKTHKGKKAKKTKKVSNGKDLVRERLNEECEEFLRGAEAFADKVYCNTKDGIVIRMVDADYTVKAGGHATCDYAPKEEGFKASKSFATRGSAVNHSSAIAKMLTSEIENGKWDSSFSQFGNENPVLLCEAKSSGIRVQIGGDEFTIKVSKKRARCVVELD